MNMEAAMLRPIMTNVFADLAEIVSLASFLAMVALVAKAAGA
jgi:hypothetical protein